MTALREELTGVNSQLTAIRELPVQPTLRGRNSSSKFLRRCRGRYRPRASSSLACGSHGGRRNGVAHGASRGKIASAIEQQKSQVNECIALAIGQHATQVEEKIASAIERRSRK